MVSGISEQINRPSEIKSDTVDVLPNIKSEPIARRGSPDSVSERTSEDQDLKACKIGENFSFDQLE